MRIVTALIAGALLGAGPGASFAQGGMAPPRVTVQSLEPVSAIGTEQRFRAVLVIDNLNTEPLKLRGIEFSLQLAHQGMLDGHIPAMTVEALDRRLVTLELQSELIASAAQLQSFVEGPENTLPYEIVCKVTFERRRIDPVNFRAEGRVPFVMPGAR
ncbi:MAG TPA: hypothetical protein VLI71_15200 [Gammaproteobacteria bacterium]|nr:hypothetical protein [Gammaproteobacteria bacterium]